MLNLFQASPNEQSRFWERVPFVKAAEEGFYDILLYFIEKGASLTLFDENLDTPLHKAVSENHLDCVELLIERGSPIALPNFQGRTPLMIAVEKGNYEIMEYLLNHGADRSTRNSKNKSETALTLACRFVCHFILTRSLSTFTQNDVKALRILLTGWDPSKDELHEAFTIAVRKGKLRAIKYLLSHGAPLYTLEDKSDSVIFDAVRLNRFPIIKLLVDYGADILQYDWMGFTPLMVATCVGNVDTVYLLLNRGKSAEHF